MDKSNLATKDPVSGQTRDAASTSLYDAQKGLTTKDQLRQYADANPTQDPWTAMLNSGQGNGFARMGAVLMSRFYGK